MALPTAFSNNTSPTGPELDGNFAAVGALTVIPCTVAGTNTLVLTPNANTPTTNAYANYGRFSGVASATSTGAVTARIGGLAALPVYRDTPSGPAALVGGEIVQNCAFVLIYDSALNSSNGGWHLVSQANSFPYTGGTIANGTLSSLILTGAGVTGNTITGSSIVIGGTISGTVGTLAKLSVGATAASITRILSGLGTLVYSLIAAQTAQDQNMTLTGAQIGDSLSLGYSVGQTNTQFAGFIPAAGTVTVRALNAGAGTVGAFTLVARATAHGFT